MLSYSPGVYSGHGTLQVSMHPPTSHFGHPGAGYHQSGVYYHPSSPSPSQWNPQSDTSMGYHYGQPNVSHNHAPAPQMHPNPPQNIRFSNIFAPHQPPNQPGPLSTPAASSRGSKRSAGGSGGNPPPKRRCVNSVSDKENVPPRQESQATPSPVPGIGPATEEIQPEFDPKSTYGSVLNKNQPKHNSSAATDVWWFIYALRKYTLGTTPEPISDATEAYLMKRPSDKLYEGLCCRLCKP
ncbi:hypothetical protein FA13DRAFT_1784966 [Coprinellus micaceus]|uniref:Uncharacterized protein n=1 Tax=Coprinellus micaceus TaxID=71717 RepID=A0A4Y7TWV3_COPMI|nr:hypothetical protein FA13DRAFT_1784966 [Coprinellus micaceus]